MTRKFTIIELLVVIAVLGLLISVLLPSLTKARMHSISAVCKSNQSQLSKSVLVYTTKNNLTLPPIRTQGNAGRVEWKRLIFPILTQEEIPEGVQFDRRWGNGVYKCELQKQLDWENVSIKDEAKSGGILYNAQLGEDYTSLHKIIEVDIPAETIMTGDSNNEALRVWNFILAPGRSRNNISKRHFRGLNVSWVDGHVSWVHNKVLKAGKNSLLDYYYLKNKE